MTRHDREPTDELIADYLAGELDPVARSEFESRMAKDPALAEQVATLGGVGAMLTDLPQEDWEATELPELRVPADARPGPGPAPASRRQDRRRSGGVKLGFAAAGALAVALAALIVVLVLPASETDDPGARPESAPTVALRAIDQGPERASGTLLADDGTARIAVEGLEPSQEGTHYELWLFEGTGEPVSLGRFRADSNGAAETEISLPAGMGGRDFIDVSLESDGGDPGHSGRSVLRTGDAPS